MAEQYDIIIIGGGAAGLVSAKVARGFGKRVVIIEQQQQLGGECTWTGCVPSKTLIHISQLYQSCKEAKEFLIEPNVSLRINYKKVMQQVRTKRQEIYQTHTPKKLAKEKIDVVFGSPMFVNSTTIRVNEKLYKANKFIIATGTRPTIPPIEGLEHIDYLTNQNIFDLENLPSQLAIIGAGPTGIEMAQALHKLGIEITLLERSANILPQEDHEISSLLKEHMLAQGINIHTNMNVKAVLKNEDSIQITTVNNNGQKHTFKANRILIAAGRSPNINNLALEKIGIEVEKSGIRVNNYLQTNMPHIYACGDVVGPYRFSHMAEYQAVIATRNCCVPLFKKRVNYDHVIWVTFSQPDIASAGITEQQAREKYKNNYYVHRMPYSRIDRANIDNNAFGICKIITDKRGYIKGAHIVGERAGELIHEIQVGKYYNKRLKDFYLPIHAYPTYSELIWHAAKQAYISAIKQHPLMRFAAWLFKNKS